MEAAFASYAALFVTTEGTGGIKFIIGVCPEYTGLDFSGDLENFRAFVGPYATAESVGRIVGFLHHFFEGAEGLYRQHRTKNLFLYNTTRLRYAGEERGTEPVTFRRNGAITLPAITAFFDTGLYQTLDFIQLRFRIDRADVGVLVERITNDESADAVLEFMQHFLRYTFLHKEP